MKFKNTKFWKNYDLFSSAVNRSTARSTIDALIYWKLLTTYNFANFLEIGVFQGQTTGLFFESNKNSTVDAIDPNDNLSLFQKIYHDFIPQLNFIKEKSENVNLTKKYDFILIDGDHSYDGVKNDINTIKECFGQNSIIAFDDFRWPGVDQALDYFKTKNPAWVPFLQAQQTQFWHHIASDHGSFLDSLFCDPISNFIFIENTTHRYNDTVCTAKTIPALTDDLDIFDYCLEKFNC